jgi:DNA repair ATPase RecN
MAEIFSYAELESAIHGTRGKTARFYRVDLHVHTTDSHDFPSMHSKSGFVKVIPADERDLKANPDEFKRRFVQRAKEQGLRSVAVTDHNESDMAEQLSSMSDGELTILPGIEISVQTNLFPDSEVHLIAIFPQGTSSKQIDKVFPPNCGMPPSGKRGAGALTTQSIDEIIKTIQSMDGICIAAHVSSTSGVRTMVHSQNVEWLQKNYLRRYLKEKRARIGLSDDENEYLRKLEGELKPLDDEVQNAYLAFLAEHEFNAIQIQEWEHQQYYTGAHVDILNLPPIPCILSSDAHMLADLGCPGHATHIKMTRVGLDGLQKALQDPGTRIRHDATVPSLRPKHILGMAFEGGSFDGQVIGFSDNLTTLIGGRGTGKSALIEAMRYVLCQSISGLPERLRKDIQERLEFTLRDTEVKLLFADQQQEESFVLKRRFGESRTNCFALDGKPLPEIELPISQRIRAEIYGWSEIEELSDSPRKQLAILDRTIPGIDDLRLEVQKKLEELRVNGERIVALAREIQSLLPHTKGAEEIRQQLESLSTPELNEAFASFDRNEAGLRALRTLSKKVENVKSWLLEEGRRRELGQEFSEALKDAAESLGSYSWYTQFVQVIGEGASRAQEFYSQLLNELDAVKEKVDDYIAELEQERENIEAQLNSIAEKSGQGDFKTALSRRKELTEKMSKMLSLEKEIREKQTEIEQLLDIRRNRIVSALSNTRSRMYQVRMEKARTIAKKLASLRAASGISIEIEPLGDIQAFSRALGYREGTRYEGLFQKIDKQYLNKDYPGFYARKFSPHKFAEVFLKDVSDSASLAIRFIRKRSDQVGEIVRLVEGEVKEESGNLTEYTEGTIVGRWPSNEYEFVEMLDTEKVWKHLSPRYYDGEINTYYDAQKLNELLKLELSDIEDLPRILLDGKPIEGLSPGQRCSALIPIILVEGDNPLVIDQPEDNLDNKMVFDLVVDILRGLKEQRQIIVATHNPNIPVSGDTEQVVVFDSPSKERCCVTEQGSIDDEAIIKNIKTVMEGGDKAFEVRMRKYGVFRGAR